jgi:pimeloyl-ACP methyl ester carboxylesterase
MTISGTYHASWNRENASLRPPVFTTDQKIRRVAWNIFSMIIFPIGIARLIGHGIGYAAKKAILPAAWIYPKTDIKIWSNRSRHYWHNEQNNYELREYSIHTPDGATIHARHFKNRTSDNNIPTVLLFNANATLTSHDPYRWLIESHEHNHPCHFVEFDYRGVEESQGEAKSAQDWILDGESMIQFIKNHLNVPSSQIRFYGWSLGGAIAANAAALHPECDGKIICDRTFSSTAAFPQAMLPRWIAPFFSWLAFAIRQSGWNIDTVSAAKNLKNRLLIIYHPFDNIIPQRASLYSTLGNETSTLELPGKASQTTNYHCLPLSAFHIRNETNQYSAEQIVKNFIACHYTERDSKIGFGR